MTDRNPQTRNANNSPSSRSPQLIDALNDKNRLLEKQEDLLYEEHDKFVDVQKTLALEVKRNEMLSCELSTCHETVASLRSINDDLNAKLEVANKSSSCQSML